MLDKIILERHVASVGVFIVFAGLMQLPSGFVALAFVAFLFGIILSLGLLKVLSEPLDRASLVQRGVAIGMIVAGVSTISLW